MPFYIVIFNALPKYYDSGDPAAVVLAESPEDALDQARDCLEAEAGEPLEHLKTEESNEGEWFARSECPAHTGVRE